MGLILPHGLKTKVKESLTKDQTQGLIDAEALAGELHLALYLRCMRCVAEGRGGLDMLCSGGYDYDGILHTFRVNCGCRERSYVGIDITPPVIVPRTRPKLAAGKVKHPLSRHECGLVAALGAVCKSLDLEWSMRCLGCEDWATKTSEPTLKVDCQCTTRYADATAAAKQAQ